MDFANQLKIVLHIFINTQQTQVSMKKLAPTKIARCACLIALIWAACLCAIISPSNAFAGTGYRDPPEEPPWLVDEERERQRLTIEAQTGTTTDPQERYPVFAPVLTNQGRGSVNSPAGQRNSRIVPKLPISSTYRQKDINGDGYIDENEIVPVKISPLRELYSKRSGQDLEVFGYEMFGEMKASAPPPKINTDLRHDTNQEASKLDATVDTAPLGALADDIVLRSGDKVEVVFSGQRSDRDVHRINAQGLLLIPDFPPIPAAGRTLGELRESIEAQTAEFVNTKANVSIFSIRQISVLVTGHVKKPGKQRLSAFNTLLDAMIGAGGIKETGSLRSITIRRDGAVLKVDLYGLLADISAIDEDGIAALSMADSPLQDGDVIVVPPIGQTVAIAGDVARPAIYEMDASGQPLSMDVMLDLAGGVLAGGANRFMKITSTKDGLEELSAIDPNDDNSAMPQFENGSILLVERAQGKKSGQVELSGHTLKPGLHVLARTGTLSALLSDGYVLGPDVYPLAGVLERRNKKDMSPSWNLFSPKAVLDGGFDKKLQEGDIVHLFSRAQIIALSRPVGKLPDAGFSNNPRMAAVQTLTCTKGRRGEIVDRICTTNEDTQDRIYDKNIAALLNENSVFVRGGVRNPGPWPIAQNVQLQDIVKVSGGLARSADSKHIEITHVPNTQTGKLLDEGAKRKVVDLSSAKGKKSMISAGDTVQIRQKREVLVAGDTIWIGGEVRRPGTYGLAAGETLSGLIKRAGGLTQQAYPAGAIFSRARARKAEEARYRSVAMDIEHSVALARERRDDGKPADGPSEEKILLARALADQLRAVKGLGRVGIEARPDVLTANPALDVVLMVGDRLYIPPRPASVRVAGEVLSPGFLPFRPGKDARDYIEQAAGLTFFGDKQRTFVLYPDGTAQRLHISNWNHEPILVPPGSTIVIPRDPRPFDFIQTTRDLSTILANLAITVLFIDDVITD